MFWSEGGAGLQPAFACCCWPCAAAPGCRPGVGTPLVVCCHAARFQIPNARARIHVPLWMCMAGRRIRCREPGPARFQQLLLKRGGAAPPPPPLPRGECVVRMGLPAPGAGYGEAYDPAQMLFMDFRRHHTGVWEGAAHRLQQGEQGGLRGRVGAGVDLHGSCQSCGGPSRGGGGCHHPPAGAPAAPWDPGAWLGSRPLSCRDPGACGLQASTPMATCLAPPLRCRPSCTPCPWRATGEGGCGAASCAGAN